MLLLEAPLKLFFFHRVWKCIVLFLLISLISSNIQQLKRTFSLGNKKKTDDTNLWSMEGLTLAQLWSIEQSVHMLYHGWSVCDLRTVRFSTYTVCLQFNLEPIHGSLHLLLSRKNESCIQVLSRIWQVCFPVQINNLSALVLEAVE